MRPHVRSDGSDLLLGACIDTITTQNLHLHNLLKSRDNLNKIDLEERAMVPMRKEERNQRRIF